MIYCMFLSYYIYLARWPSMYWMDDLSAIVVTAAPGTRRYNACTHVINAHSGACASTHVSTVGGAASSKGAIARASKFTGWTALKYEVLSLQVGVLACRRGDRSCPLCCR